MSPAARGVRVDLERKKTKRSKVPLLCKRKQGGMHMSRNLLKLGLWGAVALALSVVGLTATTTETSAQDRVKWRMSSAFPSSLPHLGPSGVRFTKDVARMSGGKFEIKFYEPGALVPALECFDAVSKGSIESCWTTPGYDTGKYPAAAFFTTVPFGPNFGEFLAWKQFGGGNKLRDELYGQHGMVAIDCFCIGPETSGWFRKEIKSLDEMKGLKMRFFGLGARVMQKLGVSTQLLAAADIFPALERGVIDATEFSMPMMDIKLGFHQIAKFNYFPGWHQQVSCSHLLMNKKAWEALPDTYRAMVEMALGYQVMYTYAESEAMQFGVMEEMRDKYHVQVKRWTDEELAAFEKAWTEVVAEESAKDPLFKKIADHYANFRKKYAIWGDAQYMKATYLKKE
jgi:TRAP-type mannitol/chloroaromatic compound transport system substrate-binding protein